MLRVVDHVSMPGSIESEDAWGETSDAVWVLDGSSPILLSTPGHVSLNAAWYVRQFSRAFSSTFDDDPAVRAGLAADRVRSQAARLGADVDSEPARQSVATIALVTLNQQKILSIGTLGDSYCILRLRGQRAVVFGGCEVLAGRGRRTAEVVREAMDRGIRDVLHEATVRSVLAENRNGLNEPDGYYLLALDSRGAYRLRSHARTAWTYVEHCLLCTDGFYRLVDQFNAYSPDSLLDAAVDRGLNALMRELRLRESVSNAIAAKRHDDATAVLL